MFIVKLKKIYNNLLLLRTVCVPIFFIYFIFFIITFFKFDRPVNIIFKKKPSQSVNLQKNVYELNKTFSPQVYQVSQDSYLNDEAIIQFQYDKQSPFYSSLQLDAIFEEKFCDKSPIKNVKASSISLMKKPSKEKVKKNLPSKDNKKKEILKKDIEKTKVPDKKNLKTVPLESNIKNKLNKNDDKKEIKSKIIPKNNEFDNSQKMIDEKKNTQSLNKNKITVNENSVTLINGSSPNSFQSDIPYVKQEKSIGSSQIAEKENQIVENINSKNYKSFFVDHIDNENDEDGSLIDVFGSSQFTEDAEGTIELQDQCEEYILLLAKAINRFPGKKVSCIAFCTFGLFDSSVEVVINEKKINSAYKSHIIASIKRTSFPKVLSGKKIRLVL